jgi:hypothetical protein
MTSLADLLNAPSDIEFEGKTYKLREPTLIECGRFQRWLESEARASAAAAVELPEADRRQLLKDVNAEIAAKRYAYGGAVCVECLQTPDGLAKLLSIVCEDQGVTFELAKRMCDGRLLDMARHILSADASDDPGKKAAVAALMTTLGLPPLSSASSSSASPTTPAAPPPSSPWDHSALARCSPPSSSRPATATGS